MRFRFSLFLAFLAVAAFGQHNNRSARDLQFRFGNPGARSLGFGGAFVGLADDATAPVANPAGMSLTGKRSFSLEFNYQELDNKLPFYSGNIVQTNLFEFDFNLQEASASWDTTQIPYLAVVFPKEKVRFGYFIHKQANLERQYTTEIIPICALDSVLADPDLVHDCDLEHSDRAFNASTDILDLEMDNIGISLSYQFGEKFSLGASAFYSKLNYQADSITNFERIAGDVPISKLARSDDDAIGFIVGALWQAAPEFSLGLTYKRQPKFMYQATFFKPIPLPGLPDNFVQDGEFKIPDALEFGVSFHPVERMTLNVDVYRVYYSQVTDNLIDFAFIEGLEGISQTMADVTEIHSGLEWFFPQLRFPLALRVGYWLDPYHAATNNVEDSQILQGTESNLIVRDVFFLHQFEEDTNHYAAGFGLTFGRSFQLDGAFDVSDDSKDITLSGIYRF